MKIAVSINRKKRKQFENMLSKIVPLSYQVDIMSNHSRIKSRYEIPYENDKQKRTIENIEKLMR